MNLNPNRLGRARTYLTAAVLALACASVGASPAVGDLAPNEIGRNWEGDTVSLDRYAGKVVVLTFWATWCGYCLKELPVLEKLQRVAGHDHLQVIAVNTEGREVFRKVARLLKELDLQLSYDPGEKSAKAYDVTGLPHLLVIDRDGKIGKIYRGYGEDSLDVILAAVNKALQKPRE